MLNILATLMASLRSAVTTRRALALENLALRHQLSVLMRSAKRPRLESWDRLLWLFLRRVWIHWRNPLVFVRPATVVRWHRAYFGSYWRWRSRRRPGRPRVDSKVLALIRRMAAANRLWGAPRIHGELLKLGIEISERTVSRFVPKRETPPSQTWRTFLANHAADLIAIDFFTVPTIRCRVLFCFLILAHHRRRVVHFNVTEHPTSTWTAQQLVDALPWDSAPRFLLRDRDRMVTNSAAGRPDSP